MYWILTLAAGGALGGLASILLRLAALRDDGLAPWIMRGLAIAVYGIGFVIYAFALKRTNLSIAYPLMVSCTTLVVLAFTSLHEHALRPTQLVGAMFLLVAIALVSRGT